MHFLIQTIVNTPCERGAVRKTSVSSLQKANACQSFPGTHYIALLPAGKEPGNSDKLRIPRVKVWAKEDQNFPSGDL